MCGCHSPGPGRITALGSSWPQSTRSVQRKAADAVESDALVISAPVWLAIERGNDRRRYSSTLRIFGRSTASKGDLLAEHLFAPGCFQTYTQDPVFAFRSAANLEAAMRRIWLIAAVIGGLGAPALAGVRAAADQPATPAVPPASGTSSSDLSRSGGVVKPPDEVDPAMKRTPPPSGARMPVIPPPGTPGGDQSVKPK
jgi:hypothetical protein